MAKIKFDMDELRTVSNSLIQEKNTLNELETEVSNAINTLRTQGWIGKGEQTFEEIVQEQLGIMMQQYADLIKTLSDILSQDAIQEYEGLVEAARELYFPD